MSAWVEAFLQMRVTLEELYRKQNASADNSTGVPGEYTAMPLWRLLCFRVYGPEKCAEIVLEWLSAELPPATTSDYGPYPKAQRNELMRQRYANGESIPKLAIAFELSRARIHQILYQQRN